ncbi:MAG: PilZ domain-containing protein [Planctomycetota bacterium]|nr:MAG: PilZ domain-containing protein [Planctomycetota bacterium]
MPAEGATTYPNDGAGLAGLMACARQSDEVDRYLAKRGSARFDFQAPLEIRPASGGQEDLLCVRMENISHRGIAFWSHLDYEPGTELDVREWTNDGSRDWMRATVVHNTRGLRGFLIGARFATPLPDLPDPGLDDSPESRSPEESAQGEPAATPSRSSPIIAGSVLCMLVALVWVFGQRVADVL